MKSYAFTTNPPSVLLRHPRPNPTSRNPTPDNHRQVEALSRAHHCYAHLFDSCEALAHVAAAAGQPAAAAAALSRLHAYMATQPQEEGAPPDAPGLCRHVFGRLLEGGRPADLLDLPSQFHEGRGTGALQYRYSVLEFVLTRHALVRSTSERPLGPAA